MTDRGVCGGDVDNEFDGEVGDSGGTGEVGTIPNENAWVTTEKVSLSLAC